jgi:hypothetical protein
MNGPHMNPQAPRTRSGHSRKAVFMRFPHREYPHEQSAHECPSPSAPRSGHSRKAVFMRFPHRISS